MILAWLPSTAREVSIPFLLLNGEWTEALSEFRLHTLSTGKLAAVSLLVSLHSRAFFRKREQTMKSQGSTMKRVAKDCPVVGSYEMGEYSQVKGGG